jgi:hypothetical protein
MTTWKLVEGPEGIRMESAQVRAMGEEEFTWAHLIYGKLAAVKVAIFYFPSRFDTTTDKTVIEALRTFAKNSGAAASVNFWDPKDPNFEQALGMFQLKTVPAVVLASGLDVPGISPRGPAKTPLYSIVYSDVSQLSTETHFQEAINSAYEVLARSDPKEITGYIRSQRANSIIEAIGKIAASIRNEILRWKPKFGIPGGVSIQLG